MGYIIENNGGLLVHKTTFTGLEIQTMGSTPLDLYPLNNSINGVMFMPVFISFILKNTIVPFDFGSNDGPCVLTKNAEIVCYYADALQVLPDDTICNALTVSAIHNLSGQKTALGNYITSGSFQLTTLTGMDATQGDSEVTIILAGFNYKFL
jgi:hypothetical protein